MLPQHLKTGAGNMPHKKTVMLVGGGGREHAIAWKLSQSPRLQKTVAVPGSDGIAALPKTSCLSETDFLKAAQQIKPDLVIIGPEQPLADGVTDLLEQNGFTVFGPSQAAAQLEASKIFSKNFMREQEIPTAAFATCDDFDTAKDSIQNWDAAKGFVIKADTLAAGKGVVVTDSRAEALKTAEDFMVNPACTVKTKRLLIEEKLQGREVSAFAICDGKNFLTLGYACDYKRAFSGDKGANTGGMGGFSPEGWPSATARAFIETHIFAKTLSGMAARGTPFKGVLFAGLMIDGDDVSVIEYNVRLGDPETQILLPLIEDDLLEIFLAAAQGDLTALGKTSLTLSGGAAVHVVMASGGYPSTDGSAMILDQKINGLAEAENDNKALIFLAGAKKSGAGWVNTGGRVLGVTATGKNTAEARQKAYDALQKISFHGAHFRDDIAGGDSGA